MKLNESTLVFLDFETTGTNTATDKIIQVGISVETDGEQIGTMNQLVNPGIDIPEEVTKLTGITNDQVKLAPFFDMIADEILRIITMPNAVILGYNHISFDIPILCEEMIRVGKQLPLDLKLIDVGNIFKKKEERTLSAAVKFYTGEEFSGAHDALHDVIATKNVFFAQLDRYEMGEMTVQELSDFSRFNRNVDFAGKFIYNENGDIVYAIGKDKGTKVLDDIGFAEWMLSKDFPEQTKQVAQQLINKYYNRNTAL